MNSIENFSYQNNNVLLIKNMSLFDESQAMPFS